MKTKLISSLFLFLLISTIHTASAKLSYIDETLSSADKLRNEGSYQLAAEKYKKILNSKGLLKSLYREVRFKLADSSLRTGVRERYEEAVKTLKGIIGSDIHDSIWAEANESLARHYLTVNPWSSLQDVIPLLEGARDYWAGSKDIELARRRYIYLTFTLGDAISRQRGWHYQYRRPSDGDGADLPNGGSSAINKAGLIPLYEDLLKVVVTEKDKAKLYYSLAMSYMNQYYIKEAKDKAKGYFKKVIDRFEKSEWADDSYYRLGELFYQEGELKQALSTYKRFMKYFHKGDSRWFDTIKNRIGVITSPSITLTSSYTYIPGSEVKFALSWRNMNTAAISIYRVDLTDALALDNSKRENAYNRGVDSYSNLTRQLIDTGRYKKYPIVRSFLARLKDEGEHKQYSADKGLAEWQKRDEMDTFNPADGILKPGAYLVVAEGRGKKGYDMILVTDMGATVKQGADKALFFLFNAGTGEPKEGARVKYHYRYYTDSGSVGWKEGTGTTNKYGLMEIRLKGRRRNNRYHLFAVFNDGKMQAFTQSGYNTYTDIQDYRLYAYADRPAYRPDEKIYFKGIIRAYNKGILNTPSGMKIKAVVTDPKGSAVLEKIYTLNEFGTFNDSLLLDKKAALGEYRLYVSHIKDNNRSISIGESSLFRMEEYRLPEFKVSIHPNEPKGNKKGYRLGDTVAVAIEADYYFGGPVAGAETEYLVYQNRFYHSYRRPRQYSWYYNNYRYNYNLGKGRLIIKEKLKTDGHGRASFNIKTPANINYDISYYIEVRVVDKSRREIRTASAIKVTRFPYYAYLFPRSNIYLPGDKAVVDIKTVTANDKPVSADAKISVMRNLFQKQARKGYKTDNGKGYGRTELFTRFITTDKNGDAVFTFQPEQQGYYTLEFTGFDENGKEIRSSAVIYVLNKESTDIGFRHSALQLFQEKDTYRVGETARVMIVADGPGRWVLLTTEAEDIITYRLIKLTGTVKLIEFPVTETSVPNFFISALSVKNFSIDLTGMEIIVPPEKRFLKVKILTQKERFEPEDKGRFDIEVRDINNKPVSAEVSIGIVDESVYYIQGDYSLDIREFFYGKKRTQGVRTSAYFNRPYKRLVRDDYKRLVPEDILKARIEGKKTGKRDDLGMSGRKTSKDELAELKSGLVRQKAKMKVEEMSGLAETDEFTSAMAMRDSPAIFAESLEAGDKKRIVSSKAGHRRPPRVRKDFRSTVIWQPAVITDKEGRASVTVTFPDSLTTWRATAKAVTSKNGVGNAVHKVKTKKDIIVRLHAPRFFTERDKAVITANIHNYTGKDQDINISLKASGFKVHGKEDILVTVPKGGERRLDWQTVAGNAGRAVLIVTAESPEGSDAVRRTYPVIPHGIEKFIAGSMAVQVDNSIAVQAISLSLPKERIKASTTLRLMFSPSLAGSMVNALPFLADYPYGCVEQTMSRFLPAAVVKKSMADLGISEGDVYSYIQNILTPMGDPKYPGQPDTTIDRLSDITQKGLKRLYDFQHGDGGWGWWKEDATDPFMTAYVLWGLSLAEGSSIDVRKDVIKKGIRYLQKELVQFEDQHDMAAWLLHALASAGSNSTYEDRQREKLWKVRDKLNPYTRALFALSEHYRGKRDRALILARNAANGMQRDKENGTVHWGESGIHYRWSSGGVEATAFTLKALVNILPESSLIKPAVRWLSLNRRGARWKNTRDTAIALLGLADYLKITNELSPDFDYTITVNGKKVHRGHMDRKNIFSYKPFVDLPGSSLIDGDNRIEVSMKGKGILYLSAYIKYFTLRENIKPAGNEIFVERNFYIKETAKTLLKGYTAGWRRLKEGDSVKSGDRIAVEIMLDAKNNYEYLVIEDYKPAGIEAVALKSGADYAEGLDKKGRDTGLLTPIYKELRDDRTAVFISSIKEGRHKIRYEMRAETPGTFHGMPAKAHAMYVPEIRGNSGEMVLTIKDR